MSRPSFTTRPHRGFTLIELLLAIAILAILLAIILPLFSRSRMLSYRLQCAGNMKQLGTAFGLYSNDWGGYWPCPGGLNGNWTYWSQSGKGGLESYVNQRGTTSVWCCPLLGAWRSRYPARSYSMNSYLRTPCDAEYPGCTAILRGIDTGRIPEPQRTVLVYEGLAFNTPGWEGIPYYNYIYRCANWAWARGYPTKVVYALNPGPCHGKFNNYLYCDGHIVARRPGKCTVGTLSTFAEMYQWYVDKQEFRNVYYTVWARKIGHDPTAQ